jgi:hypothetical protein
MLSNQEAKWMREFKVSKIQTAEWSQKIKVGDKGNESRIKFETNEMGYCSANFKQDGAVAVAK